MLFYFVSSNLIKENFKPRDEKGCQVKRTREQYSRTWPIALEYTKVPHNSGQPGRAWWEGWRRHGLKNGKMLAYWKVTGCLENGRMDGKLENSFKAQETGFWLKDGRMAGGTKARTVGRMEG
jgi:hypothetical protein